MGIVNVTPDSFSDGGKHATTDTAIRHARKLIEEGAQIIDIGGESTRPGAEPVPIQRELERVIPLVESLKHANVALSVDTCKPDVMKAALDAGADIINDVSGFRHVAAREIVAAHPNCGLCVMHMQGQPQTMQADPVYDDVVKDVSRELAQTAATLVSSGVRSKRISLDPGFGFGKTLAHNYELLRHLDQVAELGYPVLVGMSRKSMIGAVTGRSLEQRTAGSVAAALMAVMAGARIVRVHDVAPTFDALAIWQAVQFGPEKK